MARKPKPEPRRPKPKPTWRTMTKAEFDDKMARQRAFVHHVRGLASCVGPELAMGLDAVCEMLHKNHTTHAPFAITIGEAVLRASQFVQQTAKDLAAMSEEMHKPPHLFFSFALRQLDDQVLRWQVAAMHWETIKLQLYAMMDIIEAAKPAKQRNK